MTDLTKITTPYGLLDDETKEALKAHGGPYEFWGFSQAKWFPSNPSWHRGIIYRVAHDKDTINWDHVADKFICMARDKNGEAYVYGLEPTKGSHAWRIDVGYNMSSVDVLSSYKRGTCDWRNSLMFRPGHEPKGEQAC